MRHSMHRCRQGAKGLAAVQRHAALTTVVVSAIYHFRPRFQACILHLLVMLLHCHAARQAHTTPGKLCILIWLSILSLAMLQIPEGREPAGAGQGHHVGLWAGHAHCGIWRALRHC